jgi:LPXTG-site transpeptidase (sortase) family protein
MALSRRVNKNYIKKLPKAPTPPSKDHIIQNVLVYGEDAKKVLKKKRAFRSLKIALLLIIFIEGLILGGIGYYEKYHKYRVLSFVSSPYEIVEEVKEREKPEKIVIGNYGVEVLLEEGFINQGVWKISEENASHLVNSSVPGEGGNIVVYGHNRPHIFARLKEVNVGDTITLITQNETEYSYEVYETRRVKPNVIEDVQPKDVEVLTIFTCIGFMDSERLIVKAKPVDIEVDSN